MLSVTTIAVLLHVELPVSRRGPWTREWASATRVVEREIDTDASMELSNSSTMLAPLCLANGLRRLDIDRPSAPYRPPPRSGHAGRRVRLCEGAEKVFGTKVRTSLGWRQPLHRLESCEAESAE